MRMTTPAACPGLRAFSANAATALAILVSTAVPAAADAQALPPLREGATLRVSAPDFDLRKERVRFVQWQPESLSVMRDGGTEVIDLPFPVVRRVDLLAGKDVGRGATTGLLVGGLVGGTLGVLFAATSSSCDGDVLDDYAACPFGAIGYGALGVLVGGAGGLAIGAMRPPDRWVRQPLPQELGFPEAGIDRTNVALWSLLGAVVLVGVAAS